MDDQHRHLHQQAAEEGRASAAAFDASLRRAEERELIERLTALASSASDWAVGGAEAAPTEVARLKSQVEDLAGFRRAVLDSKAWRLIQTVRGWFGRAW